MATFLVRRHDKNLHAGIRGADQFFAAAIQVVIERDTKPDSGLADPLPDLRRMIADARGEHERVEASKRGGERSDLTPDAIDEEIDGGGAAAGS